MIDLVPEVGAIDRDEHRELGVVETGEAVGNEELFLECRRARMGTEKVVVLLSPVDNLIFVDTYFLGEG